MGRGGIRANAGRPIGSGRHGEPTVRVRVPESLAPCLDKIQSILALISDYELRSSQTSDSSPRWEQLRLFLADVYAIENEEGEVMSETQKVYFKGTEVKIVGQSEDGTRSVVRYRSGRTAEVKTSDLIKGN
jgi:hypothetical protein